MDYYAGERINLDVIAIRRDSYAIDGGGWGDRYEFDADDGLTYLYSSAKRKPYDWPGKLPLKLRVSIDRRWGHEELRGYVISRPTVVKDGRR